MTTIEKPPEVHRLLSLWDRYTATTSAILAAVLVGLLLCAFLAVLAYGLAPAFGYKVWMINGGSMEPTIHNGSLVISHRVAANTLDVGDVITYRPPDASASVTHRVTSVREVEGHTLFTTQGDANRDPDPTELELTAGANKLVWSVPRVGSVLGFARGRSGILLLVAVPALLMAALWLLDEGEEEATKAASHG